MRNLFVASFRRSLLIFSLAIAFAFVLATPPAQAQSAAEAERARIMAERDQAAREWQLRNIGKVKRVDVEVEPPQVPLGKVKDDYERLQRANNEILTMLSAGKQIDYKVVLDASTEIRKRAVRLKSYLVTLEIVKDDKERKKNLDEIEIAEMRDSLLSLDASIFSLIGSPVFKNFGKVVDTSSSEKARNDLDNIIDMTERIKRSVERSMKARAER